MKIGDEDYSYEITFHQFEKPSQLISFVKSCNITKQEIVSICDDFQGNIRMYYWALILQPKP